MQSTLEHVNVQAWQLYLVKTNKDGLFVLVFDSQSDSYAQLSGYAEYVTKQGGHTYIIPSPGDPDATK